MDTELASAAWLYLGGAGAEPRRLSLYSEVPPLWCLLLAQGEVVPAITGAQEETQTPQHGLRVSAEMALANWQQFCDFIDAHPQRHHVPALATYLTAVADFLRQCADELGRSLSELWLQGDLDAVSGPFDYENPSRIAFWKWNADVRLEDVQANASVELHDITLVLDFENLDEWVRTFGLESLEHPYFQALRHLDEFEAQGTPFDAFQEAEDEDEEPVDPWQGFNYRAEASDGKQGLRAQPVADRAWLVSPTWDEIQPDLYSGVRVWVRQGPHWGLLQVEPAVELLFEPQFDAIVDSAAGELAVVCKAGRFGVIDVHQRCWRVPAVHDELRQESGLFRLRQGERYGYLDALGGLIVAPRYEQTRAFGGHAMHDASGLAWVAQDGLWGLIDSAGQERQPCRFERVEYREEHDDRGWRVWQQGRQGWVSADGALAVPCEWDEVDCFDPFVHAYAAEGIYRVTQDGKQGLLPRTGDWRIPCRYEDIEPLGVGPGAPPLPADSLRSYSGPEEGDVASFIMAGDRTQSRLLIQVKSEQGTGVIDELERQVVPMADQRIWPLGNDNLRWLQVEAEERRYQLWSVLEREPALPGWYAGVDVLVLPDQPPVLLTFERLQQEHQRYSLQCWWAVQQPAIAGRFSGLLDDRECYFACLHRGDRETLIEAWSQGQPIPAHELLDDGSRRPVFIRPGHTAIDAMAEWERRFQQGDLDAALARSRSSPDQAQAYVWARRACGLEHADAPAPAAAWIHLLELVLQGAGGADAMAQARQWLERGMAAEDRIGERFKLQLLLGRLWLEPSAGPIDGPKAFQALTQVHDLSGRTEDIHVESLYLLGQCARDGLGCAVDPGKARECWRAAASDGHGLAAQALVALLADEAERQTDPDASGQLWEEALHHAESYLTHWAADQAPELGAQLHHFVGETLLRFDPPEWPAAEEHLLEAAEAGHSPAMGLLAASVYRDRASPLRDLRQSVRWAWRYAEAQGLIKSATRGWPRWLFSALWLLRRG